ncbi:2-oxo-4-hydroxy-4-carboxy-5-ureidoimidazoline decarboxylase [Actinomadura parmotrematis]|uniref:2-oxo-4-hydroxy-4-carboxy-5-ureidoimidazoline decarboxylase n=1 Tax=Actinomadura parmotrematis TaxID=2864039 RepID=A0ABS7FVA3_9ACTN|nr:2-oxo-4-hydroxy-4-carboxy-5-ureidoimidazoline decarboxylase [Actinomadura parmotrematis]MBW8484355.1 2-oxo-4-hydroxy-4-carboxy-5-ureidoimidazoline decarboxylase [Actinomadura parmotrematis]
MDRLNALDEQDAAAALLACCASRRWAAEVAAARPYPDLAALKAASARAMLGLTWEDVGEALAAHPRIGERAGGASREAAWSRREQAGASDAGLETQQALADGNRAYEERFGHVYLICATGLSAAEMLAALHRRLDNGVAAERVVVREELAKIVDLRLAGLAAELDGAGAAAGEAR